MKLLALMVAGALGSLARYGMTLAIQSWLAGRGSRGVIGTHFGISFPLSTLVINVLGSFLLAVLVTLVAQQTLKPDWQMILGTGFLGAFTTFSTFEVESEKLLSAGNGIGAAAYIGGNLVLGFAAVLLGRLTALKFLAVSAP